MTSPLTIFDLPLIRRRLARAAPGMEAHAYLLDHVTADLADRLSIVQRTFPAALDLFTFDGRLATALGATGKTGQFWRAAVAPELAGHGDGRSLICAPEALPLAAECFDLIASALSLHLINDLPGLLLQIRRALKPDGLFLAALPGGRTLEELRASFAAGELATTGGISPRVAPFADVRDLGQLLQRAGFALPVADTEIITVTYPSPLHLMRELRGMGATNPLTERRRIPLRRDTLAAAIAHYTENFSEAGRIRATFEIVTLTGWAPHQSQQKPLRPGSAKASLRDALSSPPPSPSGVPPKDR